MSCFSTTSLQVYKYNDNIKPEMPFAVDDNSLAFHIGIRNKTLWYLIKEKNNLYKCFKIPQKDKQGNFKKYRYIQAPVDRMKSVHTVINGILSKIPLPDNVAAYVPGKNCAYTAKKHVGKEIVIGMDIKDFFNSTKRSWIRRYFYEDAKYSHQVASILADLCTYKNFLPQGSPLSGYLANLVAWHRFGRRIKTLLDNMDPNWAFTIYSDDVTLSHPEALDNEKVDSIVNEIYNIIESSGYSVNKKKTRILRREVRQKVLGCVVNEKLNIPRNSYNKIRCLIHNCKFSSFDAQAERCGKKNGGAVIQYIRGMLQYFKQVREDRFEKLNADFEDALAINGELKESAESVV